MRCALGNGRADHGKQRARLHSYGGKARRVGSGCYRGETPRRLQPPPKPSRSQDIGFLRRVKEQSGTPLAIDPYARRPPALNSLKYDHKRYAGTGLGQSLARKYASDPPSTNTTLPQRKSAASDSMKSTQSASCPASPKPPIGTGKERTTFARFGVDSCSSRSGVMIAPGA